MVDAQDTSPDDHRLGAVAREIEEFVAASGWDQPAALFGLVGTAALLEAQPSLTGEVDASTPWTPIAQESLPEGDLDEALAKIVWPESVQGAALVQEIVVLPPDAEQGLPTGDAPGDTDRLREAAANHPLRTEARLVGAVLRDGTRACVMRLRARTGAGGEGTAGSDTEPDAQPTETAEASDITSDDEIIEHPELAPNLLRALDATLRA